MENLKVTNEMNELNVRIGDDVNNFYIGSVVNELCSDLHDKNIDNIINNIISSDVDDIAMTLQETYVEVVTRYDLNDLDLHLGLDVSQYSDIPNIILNICRLVLYVNYLNTISTYTMCEYEFKPNRSFSTADLVYYSPLEISECLNWINQNTKFYCLVLFGNHYVIFHKNKVWKYDPAIIKVFIEDEKMSLTIGSKGSNIKRLESIIRKDFNVEDNKRLYVKVKKATEGLV